MKKKLFISYAREDKAIAKKISKQLTDSEIDFFLDEKNIELGDDFVEEVKQGIKDCDEFLVILSKRSIESKWVVYECGFAKGSEKKVIPYLTDSDLKLPEFLRNYQYVKSLSKLKEYRDRNVTIDDAMAEQTYLKYRNVAKEFKDWDIVVEFLEQRYNVEAFSFNNEKIPIIIYWKNTKNVVDPDSILGNLDENDPRIWGQKKERSFIKKEFEKGPIKHESVNYRMIEIKKGKKKPILNCALGMYYDNILTQYALEWELNKLIHENKTRDDLIRALNDPENLPLRRRTENSVENPLLNGSTRCAAITMSMLVVVKRKDGYYCIINRRSKEVGVSQNMYHIVPAGMFEATYHDYRMEWSIEYNIFRELLEEMYDEKEVQESTPSTVEHFYNINLIRYLRELLKQKKAEISITGICIDLLNLRPEINVVLFIDDIEFLGKRKPVLNWEYENFESRGNIAINFAKLEQFINSKLKSGNLVFSGAVTLELGMEWIKNRHGNKINLT